MSADTAELLDRVSRLVPPRAAGDRAPLPCPPLPCFRCARRSPLGRKLRRRRSPPDLVRGKSLSNARYRPRISPNSAYETCEWTPAGSARLTASLYEGYALQSIRIPNAQPHPTKLVQSAAMAAVAPPPPLIPAASAAAPALRGHPVGRAARERHLCRRSACRPSRRLLHGRRNLRSRFGRPGGCQECGAFPARLVSRRRHRRRQGPPGRRDHSRQLAAKAGAARSGSPNPTN